MPPSPPFILKEIFATELSFIKFVKEGSDTTEQSPQISFYNSHISKYLHLISANSQLVTQHSQNINSETYRSLLQDFSSNLTKLLSNDDFISNYLILMQPQLREDMAFLFCGRLPRYNLLYRELLKREVDDEIKETIIEPTLRKSQEICTLINLYMQIISVIDFSEGKFCNIENLVYEMVIFDVNFKIVKKRKVLMNKKTNIEHGMIFFPKNSSQLILFKPNGDIDSSSSFSNRVVFGNDEKVIYSKYSILQIINLKKFDIKYTEEGIEIHKNSKIITMKMDLKESKDCTWNLMCENRYVPPMIFKINLNRPLYDVQINFITE